jgi:DNA polymerase
MIEEKLGLQRGDVYIANCLRCRPPDNRDPLPDEIEACKPFLRRQLDLIQPRVVVALGNFAAKLMTGSTQGITRLREREFTMRNGTPLRCTFHPAAALRGGSAMKGIVEDFEKVKALIDNEPSP